VRKSELLMPTNEDKIKLERDLISIFLKNRHRVSDWIDTKLVIEHFDEIHHPILSANDNDVLLTKKTFINYLETNGFNKKESDVQESLFMRLQISSAKSDDFPVLISKILDAYALQKSIDNIQSFRESVKKGNILSSIKKLNDNLSNIVNDVKTESPIFYQDIAVYAEEYIDHLSKIRSGEIKDEIIKCGIEEIDYTMPRGFAPGTLTLFCADVSHFKTDMMLNIGVNIWEKSKKNVLAVPLEMERTEWFTRLYAKQTGIFKDKLTNPLPTNMTEEEYQKVLTFYKQWKEHESKLFIMEPSCRIDVDYIRREIERHIHEIKPHVVIIDYIGTLIPGQRYKNERPDLQIGEMLKDLRLMGKKGGMHGEGFAVISGAQIGREALKRVRKTAVGKVSFNSEDLRGSHEYSADADNIFVQMIDDKIPNRLNLYKIKSRAGKTTFPGGEKRANLELIPEISMIKSGHNDWISGKEQDIYGKLDDISKKDKDTDLSFSDDNDLSKMGL
jgi:replicative DNA helicase